MAITPFFTVAPQHVQVALLALMRLNGMMLMAPPFNQPVIPVQARMGMAFALVLLVWNSLLASAPPLAGDVLMLAGLGASEMVVGLTIGFIARLVMTAASLGAELIGVQIGYGLASLIDPVQNTQLNVLTRLYDWAMLGIFLALDIHHVIISAVVESFRVVPPGTPVLSAAALAGIVPLGGHMFAVGLALVAPILGVLLLTHLVLVLAARAVPQINLMSVGFPITVLVGLVALLTTLDPMAGIVGRELRGLEGALGALVRSFASGR